ncbi:MAG: HD domain-containing phosphohydrolase [Syntrophomonadaceae bacterium]|jgi:PAS domain S-box-containing protein/putative nucleotidyltransferase with HDIG domain
MKHNSILNYVPEILTINRKDNLKFVYVNQAFNQKLGYERDEAIGRSLTEIIHPDDKRALSKYNRLLSGNSGNLQLRLRGKSGEYKLYELCSQQIVDKAGGNLVLCIYRDLTFIKENELRLVTERDRYRSIIEDQTDFVIRYLPDGSITYINQACCDYFGLKREEVIGHKFIPVISESDRKLVEEYQSLLSKDNPITTYQIRVVMPDGRICWQQWTDKLVFDQEGNLMELQSVGTDITERRMAEDALRKTNQETELKLQEQTIELERAYKKLKEEMAARKRLEGELITSYQKLKSTLDGTVNALLAASEKRDPYTAGHQRRVAQLACIIARKMGFSEERVEELRLAGLLHDIGKIYIPGEILTKSGEINSWELGIIRTHPRVGYDIVKPIPFVGNVADIILQHHERMDGSGYPNGLKGDEIIIAARIIAVADVVEAMASHRPYRAAHTFQEALLEIARNRDTLYDSKVVDVCLRLFKDKAFEYVVWPGNAR